MSEDHFNYEELMLEAHRELIRNLLCEVEEKGLPGEHHFFIIFDTTNEDTHISDRLRLQYPEEMTIVLQHQYSNLKVYLDRFEIQLSFNRIPELLDIPFKAITGFVDPSVPFGLQLAGDPAAGLENSMGMMVPGFPQAASEENFQGRTLTTSDEYEDDQKFVQATRDGDDWGSSGTSVPNIFSTDRGLRDVEAEQESNENSMIASLEIVEDEADEELENEDASANIVQLDAFRKKSK